MWSPCINGRLAKSRNHPPPSLRLLEFSIFTFIKQSLSPFRLSPNSLFVLSSTCIERSLKAQPFIFTQILRYGTLLEEFWTLCSTIILSRQRDENSPFKGSLKQRIETFYLLALPMTVLPSLFAPSSNSMALLRVLCTLLLQMKCKGKDSELLGIFDSLPWDSTWTILDTVLDNLVITVTLKIPLLEED